MTVPTGIATDNSTKAFFDETTTKERLVSLYDFENREKVFPGIDSRIKFCLLTLSGAERPCPQAEFAFFLHRTEQLRDPERRFALSAEDFALFNPNTRTCPIFRTRRDMEIARKMYRRAGVFWKEAKGGEPEVNPWGVAFQRMFDMSNDSGLFRTREQLMEGGWELRGNVFSLGEKCYVPLYEAKLFHQYDHRFATFDGVSAQALRGGNAQPMTSEEKADPQSVVIPRYWVHEDELTKRLDKSQMPLHSLTEPDHRRYSPNWFATRSPRHHERDERAVRSVRNDSALRSGPYRNSCHRWFVAFRGIARATDQRTSISVVLRGVAMNEGAALIHVDYAKALQIFRDITNATNERTLVVDNIPQGPVGNNAPVIDYQCGRAVASALVLANMNSIPLDWAARLSVGGVHMSFFIVKQLPVLPPEAYLEDVCHGLTYAEVVVPRVLELTFTANELEGFAKDLGYQGPPFQWDDRRRHRLKCELDATFAHMYLLDRSELEWILDAGLAELIIPGPQT